MNRQLAIAYCAGLIDGEGCIRIHKRKATAGCGFVSTLYTARIQVRMVEESAISFLKQTLGGSYYPEKHKHKNRRPLFCYVSTALAAEKIIRSVLPFLRVKKKVALVVLKLRKLQSGNPWKHRTRTTGKYVFRNWCGTQRKVEKKAYSKAYLAKCESLFQEAKILNKVGPRT